jgi:hypothetical protein
MDNKPENVAQDREVEQGGEPPAQDSDVNELVQIASEEEFAVESQDDVADTSPTSEDWAKSQRISAPYIDDYHNRTDFRGPASGIFHTGPGDNNIYFGVTQASEEWVKPVPIDSAKNIHPVYVEPPKYAQVRGILADKRVLVLFGQARRGKSTTALRLLHAHHTETIYQLNPYTELAKLKVSDLDAGGYVIDKLAPEQSAKLTTSLLGWLSSQLSACGSHMVFTVDSKSELPEAGLDDYLMLWDELPDRNQLLEQHLWHLFGKVGDSDAYEIIRTEKVQRLLLELSLPQVVALAERLVEVIRGSASLEEIVACFDATQKRVAAWFDEHGSLEARIFMLALAVFSGAKYQMVVEASRQLQALISGVPLLEVFLTEPALFESKRSQWVGNFHARLFEKYESTIFGLVPAEQIELKSFEFQRAILDYVWHECDGWRGHILMWLTKMGMHAIPELRDMAAAAVGHLSKYDFVAFRRDSLRIWGKHQNSHYRKSAAVALSVLAAQDEFAGPVREVLRLWSIDDKNWRFCWTAAVSYGGFGVNGLWPASVVLQNLHIIAQRKDRRLLDVIRQSIFNLFQASQEKECYQQVLTALDSWTADRKDKVVALIGLRVFLKLAQEATIQLAGEEWRTLLWLLHDDQSYREQITVMWQRALNTQTIRLASLKALLSWLRFVDDKDYMYPAVRQMIADLIDRGTGRERERLRFYLSRWAAHSNGRSQTAARILASINTTTERGQPDV